MNNNNNIFNEFIFYSILFINDFYFVWIVFSNCLYDHLFTEPFGTKHCMVSFTLHEKKNERTEKKKTLNDKLWAHMKVYYVRCSLVVSFIMVIRSTYYENIKIRI